MDGVKETGYSFFQSLVNQAYILPKRSPEFIPCVHYLFDLISRKPFSLSVIHAEGITKFVEAI
jgi:ABC-type phosphate/phosphonate transport system permease subunit